MEREDFKDRYGLTSEEALNCSIKFKKTQIEDLEFLISLYARSKKSDKFILLNHFIIIIVQLLVTLYFILKKAYPFSAFYFLFVIFFIYLFIEHFKLMKRNNKNIKLLEDDIDKFKLEIDEITDMIKEFKECCE